MTLVLRWNAPDRRVATRWRGPNGLAEAIERDPLYPVAAVVGPPGSGADGSLVFPPLAADRNATLPEPTGGAGAAAWSTLIEQPVFWDGTAWRDIAHFAFYEGPPAWVHSGATIDVDFVNGRYWAGGLVSLTDLLEPDTDFGFPADFDNIQPGRGLVASGASFAEPGCRFTAAQSGWVASDPVIVVMEAEVNDTVPDADPYAYFQLVFYNTKGAWDYQLYSWNTTTDLSGVYGELRQKPGTATADGFMPDIDVAVGTVKLALLRKDGVMALSVNGGQAYEFDEAYSPLAPLEWFAFEAGRNSLGGVDLDTLTVTTRSVQVYDAAGYTATDLPTFSGMALPPGTLFSRDYTGGSLDAGDTFTRADPTPCASHTNSGGNLEVVAADVARFDYDPVTLECRGLLIEPTATNLYPNSADLTALLGTDQASWSANAATAPDGTATADKLVENAAAGTRHIGFDQRSTVNGNSYAFSVFAKPAGRDCALNMTDGAAGFDACFDLTAGSVGASDTNGTFPTGTSAAIETAGSGFYRPSITRIAGEASNYFVLGLSDGASPASYQYGCPSYNGDGSSGVHFWGLQIEAGDTATSYIHTNGSTATRAADELSFTVPAGVSSLRYTFDDDSTQDVAVAPGAYTVPTNLNRARIKRIESV